MRRAVSRFVALVVAAVALTPRSAACGGGASSATTAPSTRPATTSSATSSSSTATRAGAVTFHGISIAKTGGVDGIYVALTVDGEGLIAKSTDANVDPQPTGNKLTPAELQRLVTLALSPEWRALRERYEDGIVDGFRFGITVTGDKTVDVPDGPQAPAIAREVVSIVFRYE